MSTPMVLPPTGQPTGLGEQRPLSRREQWFGVVIIVLAVFATRLPLKRIAGLLAAAKATCPSPASIEEGEQAVRIVHAGARWFPGRAACLERSIAAVLAAAIYRRRSLDLCIGARLDPYASHAWVEVADHEDRPLGEPGEPDRPYLTLLRI